MSEKDASKRRRNLRLSIRSALVGGMLVVGAAAGVLFGFLGIATISGDVLREAQERVNRDLLTINADYQNNLDQLKNLLENFAADLNVEDQRLSQRILQAKEQFDLTLLNVCTVEGEPVAGSYGSLEFRVPVVEDPVLRRALEGEAVAGSVLLDESRLRLEAGEALVGAMTIQLENEEREEFLRSALFQWAAIPLKDEGGRVDALLYGGKALNHNYALVDRLRDLVFGDDLYQGKPLGTITVFLEGIRVATNVLGPNRQRAVGTEVSGEVRRQVLQQGRYWNDRAWVVDAWYISAYSPLRNPDGEILGMLYAGLLEAPYDQQKQNLIIRFLGLLVLVGGIGLLIAWWIIHRTVSPLERLTQVVGRFAQGEWDGHLHLPRTYSEIDQLAQTFREMSSAIEERDRSLKLQNQKLIERNEQVQKANRNYMEMLGFVTHEIKSPLAAIQSMIMVMNQGMIGELPEKAKTFLERIRRNCEELQDMVKNYLDLSRVERGELSADKKEIDLVADVVQPCVEQSTTLFESRSVNLQTRVPESLEIVADPELLRIALTNFLTNAAKYGRENGLARLEASRENGSVRVNVWNEGVGFSEEDRQKLFQKFSRLQNTNTRDKRGSGVGLFLTKQIVDLHQGEVKAESEPGQWAQFSFRIPVRPEEG